MADEQPTDFYRELVNEKSLKQILAEDGKRSTNLEEQLGVKESNPVELPVVIQKLEKPKKLEKVVDPYEISTLEIVNSFGRDLGNGAKFVSKGVAKSAVKLVCALPKFAWGSLKLTYSLPTFARQSLEKNKTKYDFRDDEDIAALSYFGSAAYSLGLNAILYSSLVDNRPWQGYLLPLGTCVVSGIYELFRNRKLELKKNKPKYNLIYDGNKWVEK
ncbi:MAG: hypothetical protein Q7S33_00330 [Nanoarchaeota archaeon]|nr:hypothetical protein [Nanoarchaeota archaeon]